MGSFAGKLFFEGRLIVPGFSGPFGRRVVHGEGSFCGLVGGGSSELSLDDAGLSAFGCSFGGRICDFGAGSGGGVGSFPEVEAFQVGSFLKLSFGGRLFFPVLPGPSGVGWEDGFVEDFGI